MNQKLFSLIMRFRMIAIGFGLVLTVALSLGMAFLLRFDFAVPKAEWRHVWWGLALALPVKLAVFCAARMHRGWWGSAGTRELVRIANGTLAASVVFAVAGRLLIGPAFPRSVYLIDYVLTCSGLCSARAMVRMLRESRRGRRPNGLAKNVLIYGAGWSGASLAKELHASPDLGYRVAGFIDDNPQKKNELVAGIPVLGTGSDLEQIVSSARHGGKQVDGVLIAMPSASGEQMRVTVQHVKAAGLACKTLPSIGELLENGPLRLQIRDISVEDLLSREPVALDEASIARSIAGRVVLVTGAGGSIGSELSRQAAGFGPRKLILFDQAESDLFRIECELKAKFPGLEIAAIIGDIRDAWTAEELICTQQVELIFHAAAYKHVPLMEAHPIEAARTNILGTWNMASAAQRNGAASFVLISSDKAVNPSSVMGATKRAAELIIQSMAPAAGNGSTKLMSVRFGNVLASNGSVVPLFKEQIARGGPVTLTHPEMRRYFMTTHEAVQLVLQAAAVARASATFVLDMGNPVRIADLARTMIQLSGLAPDKDIKIEYIGMRPGEKLFEELATQGEQILPTAHPKVKIFQHPAVDAEATAQWLRELRQIIERREENCVVPHLCRLIPEYQPATGNGDGAIPLRTSIAVAGASGGR